MKKLALRDKVRFVPAGCDAWGFTHAYVRYEKNTDVYMDKVGGTYLKYQLPDRTVLVTRSGANRRLLADSHDWDAVVPLLSPSAISEPLALINPYHASSNFLSVFRSFSKKVIVDSGGFQLLRGTSDYIDLDRLVEFYNANADIAMPLDLPLAENAEVHYFDAVTRYMKANDRYMLERLDPKIDLAMISHGANVAKRLKRLNALRRPCRTVAIAGLNNATTSLDNATRNMVSLSNALAVIDVMRDSTEYFHVLGVTSNFWFVLYAVLAGTGHVKTIGGDSVSHRISSLTGTYRAGSGLSTRASSIDIERTRTIPLGSMCRCPVCHVFTDLRCLQDAGLLEAHNLQAFLESKNLIADAVESYLAGRTTLKEIAVEWNTAGGYTALAKAVDYINLVIQKGYVEWQPRKVRTLFGPGNSTKALTSDGHKHFGGILRKYEVFHNEAFLPKK